MIWILVIVRVGGLRKCVFWFNLIGCVGNILCLFVLLVLRLIFVISFVFLVL